MGRIGPVRRRHDRGGGVHGGKRDPQPGKGRRLRSRPRDHGRGSRPSLAGRRGALLPLPSCSCIMQALPSKSWPRNGSAHTASRANRPMFHVKHRGSHAARRVVQPQTFPSTHASPSMSTGFATWASMPASSADFTSSANALAVSATIFTSSERALLQARRARAAS